MEHISKASRELQNLQLTNLQTDSKVLNQFRAEVFHLPLKFKDVGFSNFKVTDDRIKAIKEGLIKFSMSKSETKSLLLLGNVGSGKTHLAIAVLKNIPYKMHHLIKGKKLSAKCLFLNADQFFMKLQNISQLGVTKDEYINSLLMNHDVVCLDDLSKFNFTPAKTENLYYFINQAYMNKRRFIITSNYDEKGLEEIDPRIYSRIAEMAIVVKFNNEDYRIKEVVK
jgi:DNA replication protein DnaC